MKLGLAFSTAILAMFFWIPDASAHRLVADDGTHGTPENAISISDVNVSQVAYHSVTADAARLWFKFSGKANQTLYIQCGVPKIERLRSYRPAYAIIGPGLPQISLPFSAPEGLGGVVVTTDGVASPEEFYEPFTGTDSWTFPETDLVLPQDGTYYVVAYVPSGEPGKLWLALGKAESFTVSDILSLPKTIVGVRAFHEIGPVGGVLTWMLIAIAVLAILLHWALS